MILTAKKCSKLMWGVWKSRKPESGKGTGTGSGTSIGTVMERGTYIKRGTTFILI